MFEQAFIVQVNVICFAFLSVWQSLYFVSDIRRPRPKSSMWGPGVCLRFLGLFRPILIKFERMVSE
jgi:hypothetical protein